MVSTADRRRQKWYRRRPILTDVWCTDLQNGSYIAAIYSVVEGLFMITLAVFDVYCLIEAQPGTTHYRYFGISFLFVYSGNQHVRNLLIMCSVVSFFLSVFLIAASFILMAALRRESERKFRIWLWAMLIYTGWRFIVIIFRSIANDIYFSYHQAMLVIWLMIIVANLFFWMVVVSNYQELADVTRLEDMAKLKMGTMSSLNTSHASHSFSRHSMDSEMKNSHHYSTTPRGSSSTYSA